MEPLPIPPGPIADEMPARIVVNGEEVTTLWCSPLDYPDLAWGFLLTSGRMAVETPVAQVTVEESENDGVTIHVEVDANERGGDQAAEPRPGVIAGGPKAAPRAEYAVSLGALRKAARQIMEEAPLRKRTGGIHSAGALLPDGAVLVREDVSRHCALDKAIGAALRALLLDTLPPRAPAGRPSPLDRVAFLSSGRAAVEMVQKIVNVGAPVFAARGIPTSPAYRLAHFADITLIGKILSGRPVTYTGVHRVLE